MPGGNIKVQLEFDMSRILVVKIGAVGDVIMALPMIRYLRDIYPQASITWICGQQVYALLEHLNIIDELISVDEKRMFHGTRCRQLAEMTALWRKLGGRRFDLVIRGHSDWRYKLLHMFCRVKTVRAFERTNQAIVPIPGRHHSDEYMRLATGVDDSKMLRTDLRNVGAGMPRSSTGSGDCRGVVALAAGGAKNVLRDDALRRWPLPSYRKLAEKLAEQNYRVVVTGGESDMWVCSEFENMPVDILVGKTSIIDLLGVYQRCDLVITHDSGPLHIAGLAGAKLIGLFGPTNPYEKMPRGENSVIVWGGQELACRPCYDGKHYAKCSENSCLQTLTVDTVLEQVIRLLEKGK
jgi:heptosyltransferase II